MSTTPDLNVVLRKLCWLHSWQLRRFLHLTAGFFLHSLGIGNRLLSLFVHNRNLSSVKFPRCLKYLLKLVFMRWSFVTSLVSHLVQFLNKWLKLLQEHKRQRHQAGRIKVLYPVCFLSIIKLREPNYIRLTSKRISCYRTRISGSASTKLSINSVKNSATFP